MQQQQIAHKIWIANILASSYTRPPEEFSPHYITFKNQKVSRVNIIANVVDTYSNADNTHSSITLDDGSASIRTKAFKEETHILEKVGVGDMVLVIGKVREYNDERYIVPDIARKIGLAWGRVRRLELIKTLGEPPTPLPSQFISPAAPPEPSLSAASSPFSPQVLSMLEKSEEGMPISALAMELNTDTFQIQQAIDELTKRNEIYQNKPGHYKVL